MTRDYTTIPGYEGMTQLQARYNYLHDLLDRYQGMTQADRDHMRQCPILEERMDCRYCSFSGFLGGDPKICCAWRAEAQPDKAIAILEMLLEKRPETDAAEYSVQEDSSIQSKIRRIAEHYGKLPQMAIAQEECAELIQAISKVRRNGETASCLDDLAEELADVQIMCRQLAGLFGIAGKLNRYAEMKVDRQLRRIAEEGETYAGDEENGNRP